MIAKLVYILAAIFLLAALVMTVIFVAGTATYSIYLVILMYAVAILLGVIAYFV